MKHFLSKVFGKNFQGIFHDFLFHSGNYYAEHHMQKQFTWSFAIPWPRANTRERAKSVVSRNSGASHQFARGTNRNYGKWLMKLCVLFSRRKPPSRLSDECIFDSGLGDQRLRLNFTWRRFTNLRVTFFGKKPRAVFWNRTFSALPVLCMAEAAAAVAACHNMPPKHGWQLITWTFRQQSCLAMCLKQQFLHFLLV
jgi:hypothetical protein